MPKRKNVNRRALSCTSTRTHFEGRRSGELMKLSLKPVRASRAEGFQEPYGGSQLVLTLSRIYIFCFQICNHFLFTTALRQSRGVLATRSSRKSFKRSTRKSVDFCRRFLRREQPVRSCRRFCRTWLQCPPERFPSPAATWSGLAYKRLWTTSTSRRSPAHPTRLSVWVEEGKRYWPLLSCADRV